MTECPLEHHAGFPWLKEEPVGEGFTSRRAQLSVRGRRILDCLLVLLPSHLKSQSSSQVSSFPPALLFSIRDALQLDSAEQNDPSVLPSVLSQLRDWRLLDRDYRYSPGGIHRLALDLAGITEEASTATTGSSDLNRTSYARLRVKWVCSDSPSESQDRESVSSTRSSRSLGLDSVQECAHALSDLNERRSDAGYESCQDGRLGTPDSEDASAVVSPRHHSVSGFRSGCSACRHPRVSGLSNPPSPHMASVPLSDTYQFDMMINHSVPSSRYPKPSVQRTPKRTKLKSLQSASRVAHVDENEPLLPKPKGVQQGIGISFPRQRTHSPRISNALLPRDPFSPVAASVQRRLEPSHLLNHARQRDKHTPSHRVASVDLRLTMGNPCPNPASPNDLHPPTRAQSFSYSPVKSHGVGSVGAGVPKLSSNAVGSRSSKQLPSWTQTHLVRRPTTTTTTTTPTSSAKPIGSPSPPLAKASFASPHLLPLGPRSRPSSTSIPPRVPSDLKHRERRSVSSQTHKHTSSVPLLPFFPASPLIHPRKWQV
ncbi:hypothetical protein OG21DRAFT_1515164 [Imleria badia]|nr:hypothetical protein OG21DRAFT_1515164 [Imleria badia]